MGAQDMLAQTRFAEGALGFWKQRWRLSFRTCYICLVACLLLFTVARWSDLPTASRAAKSGNRANGGDAEPDGELTEIADVRDTRPGDPPTDVADVGAETLRLMQNASSEESGHNARATGAWAVVSLCYEDPTQPATRRRRRRKKQAEETISHFSTLCMLARRNFLKYAKRFGYKLFFHTRADYKASLDGRRVPTLHKPLAVLDAFSVPGVEYVFWMDADSLFMNLETSLDDLRPSVGKEMVVVGDKNCFMNAGHFAIRNSAWSRSFLQEAWKVYPPPQPWFDQSQFVYLMTNRSPACRQFTREPGKPSPCCRPASLVLKEVEIRDQKAMNSYEKDFSDGDFILHFPSGTAKSVKDKLADMIWFLDTHRV